MIRVFWASDEGNASRLLSFTRWVLSAEVTASDNGLQNISNVIVEGFVVHAPFNPLHFPDSAQTKSLLDDNNS